MSSPGRRDDLWVVLGPVVDGHVIVPGDRIKTSGVLPVHAHVMFRPEDVRIVAEDMNFDQPDNLHGRVNAAFFAGNPTRLRVDTGRPWPIAVETNERRTFRKGNSILLAVDPNRVLMLEPPGYQRHAWRASTGIVSHTAFIGTFAGPYPFHIAGKLID